MVNRITPPPVDNNPKPQEASTQQTQSSWIGINTWNSLKTWFYTLYQLLRRFTSDQSGAVSINGLPVWDTDVPVGFFGLADGQNISQSMFAVPQVVAATVATPAANTNYSQTLTFNTRILGSLVAVAGVNFTSTSGTTTVELLINASVITSSGTGQVCETVGGCATVAVGSSNTVEVLISTGVTPPAGAFSYYLVAWFIPHS